MSRGRLGSFNGTVTPNINMLDVFLSNELTVNPASGLKFSRKMSIQKIGIQTQTYPILVKINGADVVINSEIFELGYGMTVINSLVFTEPVDVTIHYVY